MAVRYSGAPAFVGTPGDVVVADRAPAGGVSDGMVVAKTVAVVEPGSYTASVTVTDVDGSAVGPTANGPTFAIADAALTDTTPANNVANEIGSATRRERVQATVDAANP